MRILFIGSTRRGFLALEALLGADVPVAGIISLAQDEHETDRFEAAFFDLARSRNIPLRETRFLRDPALIAWAARELGAEAAFAIGVRVLLPESLHTALPRGCWAVHDSLLPAYRGFAPLNWAIINGEPETGVTLFRIAEGVDTGDILLQKRLSLGDDETAPEAYARICAATIDVVLEGYRLLRDGKARPVPQDNALATFTCSRTPADGLIDWSKPTRDIHNLVRGLTFPYPGAFTFHEGRKLIVLSAAPIPAAATYVGRIPGRIVRVEPGVGVDVLTGDGILRVRQVSTDGRGRNDAAETIRSVRVRLGVDWSAVMEGLAKSDRT